MKEKQQLRKYVVGSGFKKNGELNIAIMPSFKELHQGEQIPYGGLLWEVIGVLP